MTPLIRLSIVLILLSALLPTGGASAQTPTINCQTVAAALGTTGLEGYLGAAKYCVILPAQGWNGDIVMFAHGYVSPFTSLDIPWDQAVSAQLNLPQILTSLGYGFAITSYSKTGLAVKEGVQDIYALQGFIRENIPSVGRIYLTGASEGGLVTTLTVEKYPDIFAGALASCGPIGSFQDEINYWGDFRVVFDHYFPTLAEQGGSAVDIPDHVITGWGTLENPGPLALAVLATVTAGDQATQVKISQLLTATRAPIDALDLTSIPKTILGLLDYNVKATNEGKVELGGNPYFNVYPNGKWKLYFSFPPDSTLNLPPSQGGVARFKADKKALKEVANNYETNGMPTSPLVILHTTGDPIVPFWHASQYLQKAYRAGSGANVTLLPVVRYGHCSFTQAEVVLGFYTMVLKATYQPFSIQQVQKALPDPSAMEEFLKLKEDK